MEFLLLLAQVSLNMCSACLFIVDISLFHVLVLFPPFVANLDTMDQCVKILSYGNELSSPCFWHKIKIHSFPRCSFQLDS